MNRARAAAAQRDAANKVENTAAKAINFITQRREQLASSILFNAIAKDGLPKSCKGRTSLAYRCVDLADETLRAMYDEDGRQSAADLAKALFDTPAKPEDNAE